MRSSSITSADATRDLDDVTPVDGYFGRAKTITKYRERSKQLTIDACCIASSPRNINS